MNHLKLYRLYREEGLAVRRRRGRKRATGKRAPMTLPQGPNQRWSLDFVADALSWGWRFRVLAVVDDFTREALALVVDTSIGGVRVVRELDALIVRRGRPLMIVSDKGTELTSRAVLEWTNRTGVEWHYIAPGKPTQNASSRASTRFRDECLNGECSRAWRKPAPSSRSGVRTTTRCGRTRPMAASCPRPRHAGPRATGSAPPTSAAGRPLLSQRRMRHEEPGLSL